MVCLKGFEGPWYIYLFRFVLLFSYLIPISLRVNLDLGKIMYSWQIQNDKDIPGTVTRSTTIPEELGRIAYLLSDKTGTLTKNIMVFKKFHLGEFTMAQCLEFKLRWLSDVHANTCPEIYNFNLNFEFFFYISNTRSPLKFAKKYI